MNRGPLAPLDGVPGVRGALVRAAGVAVLQTGGLVLLAAGLAHAIARIAGFSAGSPVGPLVLAGVGAGVRAAAAGVGEVLAARDARRAQEQLRAELVTRLTTAPGAVRAAGGSGPAAVLVTTRLQDLSPGLAGYLPALAQTLVVPPVLLVVLAATDLLSGVLVAVTLPLVPVFMVLVGLYTRDRTAAAARALDRIAGHVAELVRGLPVLTGLGRAADQVAALRELGESSRSRTLATLRIAFLSALVLELIATLSVALVAVTVGLRLVHGDLDLAPGLTALLLAPEAFAPLRALGSAFHAQEAAGLAAAEARAVLAVPAPSSDRGSVAEVAVTGLSVRFPGRSRAALPATDLAVSPGELVVLAGPSGSGKSTLLAALAGTLDPAASLSGELRAPSSVAVVPQHPRTTGVTVTDELRRHAGPSGGVGAALRRVGATELADRECRTLSPGELQRVALARALVRVHQGARLLLLDEPTAHLDADATALVADVLASLRGTVSMLLITHDPALARLADRTVTLPGGTLIRVPPPVGTLIRVPDPCASSPAIVGAGGRTLIRDPDQSSDAPATGSGRGLSWPRAALLRAGVTGAASALAGTALTALSGWLVVRAAEGPQILTLMVAIVGVRFFGLGRALLRWAERLTAHDAALRLAADTRVRVWSALARQGIAAERTPGSALGRVVGDVGLLQDLSVRVLTPPLVAGGALLVTVGALAVLDPVAAGAALLVLLATVAGLVMLHRRLDAGAVRQEAALGVAALEQTSALLEGLADLRAHGVAGSAADDLAALAARRADAARVAARAGALSAGLVTLGTGLAAVLSLAVTSATGPVAAVLGLAPLALAEPLTALAGALQRRGALVEARARLDAVLTAPVPADPTDPLPLPRPVRSLTGAGLVAGWPGGPDVLSGVDLSARAGDGWLVVRGPSGAGKSTLLAVLLAALRPRSGSYRLGDTDTDTDADRLAGDELRGALAWLPQEAHVFASSIRANLALAAPRGELSGADGEARMHAALAAAGLSELVGSLPAGLDTLVGSGGTALSGGERRRLAVARALLADREVVLLDEPTAHLDAATAAALVRDLRTALAGRTVVCVTHDDDVTRAGDTVLPLGTRVTRAGDTVLTLGTRVTQAGDTVLAPGTREPAAAR